MRNILFFVSSFLRSHSQKFCLFCFLALKKIVVRKPGFKSYILCFLSLLGISRWWLFWVFSFSVCRMKIINSYFCHLGVAVKIRHRHVWMFLTIWKVSVVNYHWFWYSREKMFSRWIKQDEDAFTDDKWAATAIYLKLKNVLEGTETLWNTSWF